MQQLFLIDESVGFVLSSIKSEVCGVVIGRRYSMHKFRRQEWNSVKKISAKSEV